MQWAPHSRLERNRRVEGRHWGSRDRARSEARRTWTTRAGRRPGRLPGAARRALPGAVSVVTSDDHTITAVLDRWCCFPRSNARTFVLAAPTAEAEGDRFDEASHREPRVCRVVHRRGR